MTASYRAAQRIPILAVTLLIVGVFSGSAALPFPTSRATSALDGRVDTGAVDDFLGEQVSRHGIPGLSVAIIEDGQVSYTQGYGSAGTDRPMTANTPQPIASMTKPFTAVAVLQLVDEGLVDLDAPVQVYLPEFEVADHQTSTEITVRQLLTHTSGLADAGYGRLLNPETSLEEGVRDLQHAAPTAEPGTKYQYFNPNYSTLALLVQEVTGRPYAEVVAERILTPLAMTDSTADPDLKQNLAQGYVKLFGFAISQNAPVRHYRDGADNLVSTAADMARFAIAVGLPSDDSTNLLSADSSDAMNNPTGGLGYSLGWEVTEVNGERVGGHDGLDPTYSGQMAVLPENQRGYVLLINQGHLLEHSLINPQLRSGMIHLLAGRDVEAEGVSARMLGWALLAVFAVIAFFSVRSLVKLRSWPRRRIGMSSKRQAWEIVSHFFTAALLIGVMYIVIPTLLGRAYNLREVGLYHLPDITLMVAVSVVADIVSGSMMLVLNLAGRRTARPRLPSEAEASKLVTTGGGSDGKPGGHAVG
ncbi:serine hydrolase domain-containing protein [Mycetocola miduiensis]|uniref:CubicO group peptidase, beta-lactamase class C family n=1 Tax=Mycetocola miduiensis TaxID=995034 RepID=A0A1I5AK15_9MICO|nr:serine hydrolase domain-containing protein [Mycetocola miduiensis]SFN62559.1 CubicO group peptidase, beta-lactamase class C family [Mycetocola miduiensis]